MTRVKKYLKSITGSGGLFVLLSSFYPVVLLTSKNWFVYETDQLLYLLVIPAFCVTLALLTYLLFFLSKKILVSKFLSRKSVKFSKAAQFVPLSRILFLAGGLYILNFLLKTSLQSVPIIVIVVGILTPFLAFFVYKKGFFYLNMALFIMCLTATGEFLYLSSTRSIGDDFLIEGLDRERDMKVKFVDKPNIYLIHLESYHSPAAMRNIYGIDNSGFVNELENMGFSVSNDSYSNYQDTLTGISSIFLQQHHYYTISFGLDDAIGARDMIGGRLYNPTLSILKNNGYKVSYIHNNTYSFMSTFFLDYVYPKRNIHDALLVFQNPDMEKIVREKFDMEFSGRKKSGNADFMEFQQVLWNALKADSKDKHPTFYFIKPESIDHSPSDGSHNWEDSENGWVGVYTEMVEKENPIILETIEKITKMDPSAIILLYGDHGAWRYRNIWVKNKDEPEVNDIIYIRRRLNAGDVAHDILGTFLALRYPNGDATVLDGETPVNYFRILFSELSSTDTLLKDKPANDSYINTRDLLYVLVREGSALDRIEVQEKDAM